AAKTEFLKEGIEPAFAGERGTRGVKITGLLAGVVEPTPRDEHLLPRALDDLVQLLSREEVIGVGGEPVEILPLGNTLQQLRRQNRAFAADGGEEGTGGGALGVV